MEQKRCGDNVFAALEQPADVLESRGAGGVEDAVGVQLQDLLHVGGRGDADRFAPDERADVNTVLRLGVDQRADEVEIVSVVEDGGDHFAAHRAGSPLNHPIHARTVASRAKFIAVATALRVGPSTTAQSRTALQAATAKNSIAEQLSATSEFKRHVRFVPLIWLELLVNNIFR